jgi:LysR family transcriptional regulator, hydrogen peroxide-inducible genes activator
MVKVKVLEYLTALAQYKHFGKAAEACFVSQPTLSGQIMKLEQRLALQLVERNRGNIMLTPAGERLVSEAKKVLAATQSFEDSAKELLDPFSGDLHLGLIPTLAPYLLPHIMEKLNKDFPKINFYLHENKTQNLLTELDEGKLDLLILPWLEPMERFARYDLFDEPLLLAAPANHPLAQQKTIKLSDLDNQKILTLEDGHCLRDQALGYCFSAGADEDSRFNATSLETLRYMVASGLGITLLPELATTNLTNSDSIRYINFSEPQPTRLISLVIRENYSRMACIRAIVKTVRNAINGVV